MEQTKLRRIFTPEQKFEILKDMEKQPTIKEGLAQHGIHYTTYTRWQKQLAVGVRASLRNTRPLKAPETRRLEAENRKLKEIVLNQSLMITDLKKEMRLD